MTETQIRNVKLVVAGGVLVFFGGIYGYFYFFSRRAAESRVSASRAETITETESARAREMRLGESRDPAAALKIADAILAKPESDAERRIAQRLRPELLHAAAVKALEAGRAADAQALRERLEQTYPTSPETERLRNDWRRSLANAAMNSLPRADRAATIAAYRALWDAGVGENERTAFEDLFQDALRRWQAALSNHAPDADARLAELLEVFSNVGYLTQAANTLAQSPRPAALLAAQGDTLAKSDRPHTAVVWWEAAWVKLRSSGATWADNRPLDERPRASLQQALQAKMARAWTVLGDRLVKGERIAYVLLSPRDAYEAAIEHGRGLVEEMEAITKLLAFEAAEANRLAAPLLAVTFEQLRDPAVSQQDALRNYGRQATNISTRLRDAVRVHGVRLWECCLDTPAFDPWPGVPATVRESIDAPAAASPKAPPPAKPRNEIERRKKLAEHYRTDFWHVPLDEVTPLRLVARQLNARAGLYALGGDAEGALALLRWVLRDKDDAALNDAVVKTLRERITRSREAQAFNQFYLLSGFYAGEIGLPAPGDPFREEFRQGLDAAVKSFRKGDTMKLIFVLSLVAQCFPHEDAGQAARAEAFKIAFESLRIDNVETGAAADMPTTLAGYGVDLLNNKTSHHLLCLYRGPDEVLVHSWPWRRGTVVMRNGDYDVVVLCPDGTIHPYRGRFTAKNDTRINEFVIRTVGPGAARQEGLEAPASGAYQLLYAPASAGPLYVMPEVGLPLPAK